MASRGDSVLKRGVRVEPENRNSMLSSPYGGEADLAGPSGPRCGFRAYGRSGDGDGGEWEDPIRLSALGS